MNLLTFGVAPKAFKKVKTVNAVRLADRGGALHNYSVTVYLSTAGTPVFSIFPPAEYLLAWDKHRSGQHQHTSYDGFFVRDGAIQAADFDETFKRLDRMSDNYKRFIESITIKKVLSIETSLIAPVARISYDPPSFNKMRNLVGLRWGIYWLVNNALYVDDRRGYRFDEDQPEDDLTTEPTYDQLRPSGASGSCRGTLIPYTKAAHDALIAVEATLERAATLLHSLNEVESAQALLEGGGFALLSQPTTIKESE